MERPPHPQALTARNRPRVFSRSSGPRTTTLTFGLLLLVSPPVWAQPAPPTTGCLPEEEGVMDWKEPPAQTGRTLPQIISR